MNDQVSWIRAGLDAGEPDILLTISVGRCEPTPTAAAPETYSTGFCISLTACISTQDLFETSESEPMQMHLQVLPAHPGSQHQRCKQGLHHSSMVRLFSMTVPLPFA